MKKILSLFILVITIFTLVACGGTDTSNEENNNDDTSSFMASSDNGDIQENTDTTSNDTETESQDETQTDETQVDETKSDSATEQGSTETQEEEKPDTQQDVVEEPTSDYTLGYDAYTTDKALKIYYFNSEKEEILIEADGYYITQFNNAAHLPNSPKIFYSVNPNPEKRTNGAGANNGELWVYSLQSSTNQHLTGFDLQDIITDGTYKGYLVCSAYYLGKNSSLEQSYVIVDENGETLVNIGDDYDIFNITAQIEESLYPSDDGGEDYPSDASDWIENEYVHNQYVDYSGYTAVVIEQYDGINYDVLQPIYGSSDAYDNLSATYDIAVFGTIYNAKLLSYSSMGSEPVITDVAGELTDVWILTESSFPTDFSYDLFTFYDSLGNYHEIVIEDMSGENAIEFCYAY